MGGGFEINYTAPTAGTVYWVEETTQKILQTRSVTREEDVEFKMQIDDPGEFAQLIGIDQTKAKLGLYFIPNHETRKGPFTEAGIPARQYQVGGGFDAEYKAPADGTVYWVESNSEKIIATRPVKSGEVALFKQTAQEVQKTAGLSAEPVNVRIALYFIPSDGARAK